jgi:hypothetical protein
MSLGINLKGCYQISQSVLTYIMYMCEFCIVFSIMIPLFDIEVLIFDMLKLYKVLVYML